MINCTALLQTQWKELKPDWKLSAQHQTAHRQSKWISVHWMEHLGAKSQMFMSWQWPQIELKENEYWTYNREVARNTTPNVLCHFVNYASI